MANHQISELLQMIKDLQNNVNQLKSNQYLEARLFSIESNYNRLKDQVNELVKADMDRDINTTRNKLIEVAKQNSQPMEDEDEPEAEAEPEGVPVSVTVPVNMAALD
jgi:basic membrane lipoprotein Med (substrate-binding protein (PBP1-ABC) superfamily)